MHPRTFHKSKAEINPYLCRQFSFHFIVMYSKNERSYIMDCHGHLGAVSIRKTILLGMAIPMLKIRRPTGRLIFNMGIPIPGKTVFYIETGPWWTRYWTRSSFELLSCLDIYALDIWCCILYPHRFTKYWPYNSLQEQSFRKHELGGRGEGHKWFS